MKVKQTHIVVRDNGDFAQVIEAEEDALKRKGKYYNCAARYFWVAGLSLAEIPAARFIRWAARAKETKETKEAEDG